MLGCLRNGSRYYAAVAKAISAMAVISLPLTRPVLGENDTPAAETGNQSAYNIIVHSALQRTESKLYRIGHRCPL